MIKTMAKLERGEGEREMVSVLVKCGSKRKKSERREGRERFNGVVESVSERKRCERGREMVHTVRKPRAERKRGKRGREMVHELRKKFSKS